MAVQIKNTVSQPLTNYINKGSPPVKTVETKSEPAKSIVPTDGGTLTIINKDTGEVIRQGTPYTGTGLPSITGDGQTPTYKGWSYKGVEGKPGEQVVVSTNWLTGLISEKGTTADPKQLTQNLQYKGITTTPEGKLQERVKTVSTPARQFYDFQSQKYPEVKPSLAQEVGAQTDMVLRAYSAPARERAEKLAFEAKVFDITQNKVNKEVESYQSKVKEFNDKYSNKNLTPAEYSSAIQEQNALVSQQQALQSKVGALKQEAASIGAEFQVTKSLEAKAAFYANLRTQNIKAGGTVGERVSASKEQFVYDTKLNVAPEQKIITPTQQLKEKITGYAPSAIGPYKVYPADLTPEGYNKGVEILKSQIEKEAGFKATVVNPLKQDWNTYQNKWLSGKSQDLNLFNNPVKDYAAGLYDFGTSLGGYGLTQFAGIQGFENRAINKSLEENKRLGLINPYATSLRDAFARQDELVSKKIAGFYLGKQTTETMGYLYGGGVTTVSIIGGASRARNYEELVLPVAFGVAGRLGAGFIGGRLSAGVSKLNAGIYKASTKFISKTPTLENEIMPNIFPIITDSQAAKGILITGGALEIGGIGLVPNEYKKEYIRNVGLYNSFTPLAYKATDVGIMLGKYGTLRTASAGFTLADTLGIKYKGESIRAFDGYYAKDMMQTDLTKTPIFKGTEKQMLALSQDIERPGIGVVYKKYGLNPKKLVVGSGISSGANKLPDVVEPGVVYYEGAKGKFFAPEINPIAMRMTGIRAKLFGPEPGLLSDYSLGAVNPSLEFRTLKSATAISLKGKNFTSRTYDQLKEIFGYKNLQKSFTKDVMVGGVKAPKGMTIKEIDYAKITGGKGARVSSRAVKSREFIALIGEKNWVENFTETGGSSNRVMKQGGFTSTQSRAIGATSESEYFSTSTGVRVQPMTKVRALARKYGFADAYVWNDFEAIPMNYTVGKDMVNRLSLAAPQNMFQPTSPTEYKGKGQKLLQGNSPTEYVSSLPAIKENMVTVYSNPKFKDYSPVVTGQKGGMTKELERTFGNNKRPKYDVLGKTRIALPTIRETSVSVKDNALVPNEYKPKYEPKYSLVYAPKYSAKYEQVYEPIYAPKYVPEYIPTYTPKYTPPYEPVYTPKYVPEYTPTYTPKYTPPYTPKYPIKYVPDYMPKYIPKYPPEYPPIYPPKYVPKRTPRGNGLNELQKITSKGYVAYARVKGKFRKVSKVLPYGKAFGVGKSFVEGTTARTFLLKEAGLTSVTGNFKPDYAGLRQSKTIKGSFVEINKKAINTFGEKFGLRQAKKKKGKRLFK